MESNLILFKASTPELHTRLQTEFYGGLHPICRAFFLDLGAFTLKNFDKQLVITCVFRSPQENEAVGGMPGSSHCSWRAGDARSSMFTDNEIATMLDYAQSWGRAIHFIHESGGTAPHFHGNVNRSFLDEMGLTWVK